MRRAYRCHLKSVVGLDCPTNKAQQERGTSKLVLWEWCTCRMGGHFYVPLPTARPSFLYFVFILKRKREKGYTRRVVKYLFHVIYTKYDNMWRSITSWYANVLPNHLWCLPFGKRNKKKAEEEEAAVGKKTHRYCFAPRYNSRQNQSRSHLHIGSEDLVTDVSRSMHNWQNEKVARIWLWLRYSSDHPQKIIR